jgi:hypothetical protein
MRRGLFGAGALAAVCLSYSTQGATIFSDNFDSENFGLALFNYDSFQNFSVTSGSVDLVGNGSFFDPYPGNGLYVDLDGSTQQAGTLTSVAIPVTPGDYVLYFDLGGSQRGDENTVDVRVETNFASTLLTLASSDPLSTYSLPFSVNAATSITLAFEHAGGDNFGLILDNVRLDRLNRFGVPDGGGTLGLLALGTFALGALARRP